MTLRCPHQFACIGRDTFMCSFAGFTAETKVRNEPDAVHDHSTKDGIIQSIIHSWKSGKLHNVRPKEFVDLSSLACPCIAGRKTTPSTMSAALYLKGDTPREDCASWWIGSLWRAVFAKSSVSALTPSTPRASDTCTMKSRSRQQRHWPSRTILQCRILPA